MDNYQDINPVNELTPSGIPMMSSSSEIVEKVYACFREAKEHKQMYSKDWARYYLLYAGKHWSGDQPSWMSTPVINLTFSVIETIVPILTDSRPQISVAPRAPEHEGIADVLGSLIEWLWEANDMETKLPKIMRNAMIFGNGFCKILWNPDLREGLGDIEIVPVDPSHIFISPYARTLQESDYVLHAENMPRAMVSRMYPGIDVSQLYGPKLAELTLNRSVTSQVSGSGQVTNFRLTDGSGVERVNSQPDNNQNAGNDLVTVIEKWEKTPQGLVQTVVVNDQLIMSQPSPFTHGRFPFVHFVDYQNTWSSWAMGEVQQVEQLQISVNKRRGHIQDILRYTATPIMVVDPASGVEYEQLRPRPNLVIPAEGGMQSIGWLQPPTVPNALFEVNELDKHDFDLVLGNADVLSGRTPPGVEAGVALQMLQEAANVRMRLKVRNLENSLKQLGEILIGMIQEFYTTERMFRISGQMSVQLQGEPLTKDQFMSINQPQGGMEIQNGEPSVPVLNQIPPIGAADFDVRIGPGSTLPISRAAMFSQAMEMFQAQIVDDEEVLKNSGFPHWREILMRSRMFWQQRMMQQAGIQQMGAMPGQEPGQIGDNDLDMALEQSAAVPPPAEGQ